MFDFKVLSTDANNNEEEIRHLNYIVKISEYDSNKIVY